MGTCDWCGVKTKGEDNFCSKEHENKSIDSSLERISQSESFTAVQDDITELLNMLIQRTNKNV